MKPEKELAPKVDAAPSAPVAQPNPQALNVLKHSEAPIARPNPMAINELHNSLSPAEIERRGENK